MLFLPAEKYKENNKCMINRLEKQNAITKMEIIQATVISNIVVQEIIYQLQRISDQLNAIRC